MSRPDDAAAWDDLVRRLEAMDGGDTTPPDDAPHPAGEASPPAGPASGDAPFGPRSSAGSGARPSDPPLAGPADGPRAVAGFDFQVDPALFGPSRGASAAGASGGSGPRDWSLAEDPDEGSFEPPEPEPILAGRPDRVVAWVAAIGLPLLMIAMTIFWAGSTPPLLWPVLLIGALGAWAYLFWRLPQDRADDGDDGARI
ncbi:hypothetical protein [Galactobacter valiniphilus]|nr:hypothetical protein [Galactobacter valiniphilus]